ncbi:integral membrane protein [Agrilactobacillus composti DSM 18527 = JCM 14202]|uniref:Integral membrane protein n=1 Tax=Agrilactobacillus composti DSM 18527 = JCM 14202 TaxID=1423734 RepID=A0A0R1XZB9_9LACO|nr:DUF975 family protein [Agrilactobacillus composti]KRM33209.1 integral membrane protein [Agrilactobacillus composti DSM 18527 = JCM 14202]
MSRQSLKAEARQLLNKHYGYFLILFIPFFVIEILSWLVMRFIQYQLLFNTWFGRGFGGYGYRHGYYGGNHFRGGGAAFMGNPFGFLTNTIPGIVLTIATVSATFILIDALRQKQVSGQPFRAAFKIFTRGEYFIGTVLINILTTIYTALWTLLLIVPGIVKSLAYSQSAYVYRDAVDNDQQITYSEAITRSRVLMKGHKWELFVIYLSFIGWYLIVGLTAGLAAIWVQPYLHMTLANFYVKLVTPETATTETTPENPETTTAPTE